MKKFFPVAPALLAACFYYEGKYDRPGTHVDERAEENYEIWVRGTDNKIRTRLGYMTKEVRTDLGDPHDQGRVSFLIRDDNLNPIGRAFSNGSVYRYSPRGEFVYLGTWGDDSNETSLSLRMLNGLRHFFGYGPFTNLYIGPINPFRD